MWELHVHHGGQRGHQDGYEPVGVGAVGAVDQVHRRQLDVHLLAGDPLQHVGQALVVRVQLDLAGTVEYVVPVRGKLKFELLFPDSVKCITRIESLLLLVTGFPIAF